jgi:hypothetical protein
MENTFDRNKLNPAEALLIEQAVASFEEFGESELLANAPEEFKSIGLLVSVDHATGAVSLKYTFYKEPR